MDHRRLLFGIAVGLLGIGILGGAWVGAGWIWDAANAVGFAAAALLIFLHIETGAARKRPAPVAAFHARLHSNVALLALVLVVVHVVALLADDAVTIEYWKLSAPPYMLAGIVALLLMAAIVAERLSQTASLVVRHPNARFAAPTASRRLPSPAWWHGTSPEARSISIRSSSRSYSSH